MNLSTPTVMVKYAQEIIDGRSNDDILACLVEPEKAKVKPQSKKSASSDKPNSQLESYGLW